MEEDSDWRSTRAQLAAAVRWGQTERIKPLKAELAQHKIRMAKRKYERLTAELAQEANSEN